MDDVREEAGPMLKIVIADDSTPVRQRIVKLLASIGNVEVVGEAIDGIEAAVMIRKKVPDVVLLDLNMPKLSGLEILPRIKEAVAPPVVVVLTNHSTSPLRSMCIRNGADFFFDKTTEFESAIAVIEKMCKAQASAAPAPPEP
jgi:DNA-binding NarL/FixJ family response regulator